MVEGNGVPLLMLPVTPDLCFPFCSLSLTCLSAFPVPLSAPAPRLGNGTSSDHSLTWSLG